jgi:bifunctional UDP-N-acetylglucosamine pyrophosphorylase / glucosamine-1-phosphate N-acetyltransferase
MEINTANWKEYAAPTVDPAAWTAIVPAAGYGSRLHYDRPKILYPIAGRPIVQWLLDLLSPNCQRVVFVLSPAGRASVEDELNYYFPGRYDIVIQDVATGMGDAVQLALPVVQTRNVAIVWGDQVALRPSSVEHCIRLHAGPLEPDITCPTVFRDHPYVHFDRDSADHITGMRQSREGDTMPEIGESDTGFFCFKTDVLRALLAEFRQNSQKSGTLTHEFNFVPVIPLGASKGLKVLTPHLMTREETIGINSKEDALIVEAFLRKSNAGKQPTTR